MHDIHVRTFFSTSHVQTHRFKSLLVQIMKSCYVYILVHLKAYPILFWNKYSVDFELILHENL